MKMEKKKIRIGELADHLKVERFVVRFWEKEFGIKAQRSDGGQRFYNERDLKKFETIKELLYEKKFTIAGAKKFLKGQPVKPQDMLQEGQAPETIIASQVTSMEPDLIKVEAQEDVAESVELLAEADQAAAEIITAQILELHKKLIQLRELL
jgi:DNA-binding transcriptional MerR regulator